MINNLHNWSSRDVLALTFLRGLNGVHIRGILEEYSSLNEFFGTKPQPSLLTRLSQENLFSSGGRAGLLDEADKQIELCDRHGVDIISWQDERYPALLRHIAYPPPLLFVKGTVPVDAPPSVAIVGTRRCTQYGKLTAERFAEVFHRHGVIVCSGLAYGIDMAAHSTVLKSGGVTYAVIASGIDMISPSGSARIAAQISENGAVISEYRCGVKALPAYFPQRNRIISGISLATVVVESDVRGGALITAQFALDQQRELFAVPGNISSDKSAGTNMLIRRNMAIAALSPEDVLRELNIGQAPGSETTQEEIILPDYELRIYEALNFEPLHVDTLAERLNSSVQEILVNLLSLEFRGLIRQLPGKNFIRQQ